PAVWPLARSPCAGAAVATDAAPGPNRSESNDIPVLHRRRSRPLRRFFSPCDRSLSSVSTGYDNAIAGSLRDAGSATPRALRFPPSPPLPGRLRAHAHAMKPAPRIPLRAGLRFAGLAATAVADPVKVIFDTDYSTDCDDPGALAVLHALADLGEVEILATG